MANEFLQIDTLQGKAGGDTLGTNLNQSPMGTYFYLNQGPYEQLPTYEISGLQKYISGISFPERQSVQEKSLISSIPSKEGEPRKQLVQQQVWFMPLMLLLFVLYGWVTSAYSKVLSQEFKEFFYPKSRNDMFTASMVEVSKMKALMHTLSIFSITIFCYFVLTNLLHHKPSSFGISCLMLLLVFVAYVMFKFLVTRLLCYVFFDGKVWIALKQSFSTLTSMLAIALFVVDVIAAYAPDMMAIVALYVGLGLCVIALLLYVFRILSIFFTGISSLFYLILYLCTLEILPSIVLVAGLMSVV